MEMLLLFSKKIRLDPAVCLSLIKSASQRYKKFYIPKRNGKKRLIAQPTPAIKSLQRIAIQEYLLKLPVHPSATAYIKGIGIKKNALEHVENKYILKLDFNSFFHSIVPNDLCKLDMNNLCNLSDEEIELLKSLFFWKPTKKAEFMCLSIGAPSSPYLSNTIMFDLDTKIYDLCYKYGAKYTRYSDDITVSSNTDNVLNIIFENIKLICDQSESPNVKLNSAKTIFASKKNKRTVTGLVITNDGTISLGRDKKRQIRAMIHKFINSDVNYPDITNKINGYIAYASDVEPEFVMRLARTYEAHKNILWSKGIHLFKPS